MLALVTGATGFLGSHVARILAEQGADLRLLVRPTSDLRNLDDLKNADRVVGDLRDAASISKARVTCSKLRGNKAYGAWCTRRVSRPWASVRARKTAT